MPNPIEIERRFQNLLNRLAFPASPRQRLFSIISFLQSLDHAAGHFESYGVELLQQVPALIHESEFAGVDPTILLSLCGRLFVIQEALSPEVRPTGLAESLSRLEHLTALQFAFVGDMKTAVGLSGDTAGIEWINQLALGAELLPYARLQRVHEEARRSGLPVGKHVSALVEAWPADAAEDESVCVPVIEQQLVEWEQDRCFGSLRRVTLKVLGPADQKDILHTDVAVYGVDSSSSNHIETVAEAARRLVLETYPGHSGPFINARVLFDGKHELHRGDSSDLAIGALAYSAMVRSANERNQYRVPATAAITGVLKADGQVLPVDPDGLAHKVEAVFFSAISCMVLPRQQLASAEGRVDNLRARYPNRHLALIGVGHLRELFYDRRIAIAVRVPIVRHAVRKVWKWRRPIAALSLLTLALTVFRLAYGPLDKNPVLYEFSGEMLVLKNKSNQKVDEIRVGKRTVEGAIQGGTMFLPVAFADIDGDGRNEVFWWHFPHSGSTGYTIVSCKSVGQNKPLWSVTTTRSISIPKSTDVGSPEFAARQLVVADLDGDGKYEVLLTAAHNAYPSLVLKLDALTGKEQARYLHIGHLDDMKIWDLDGDGIKEVILCGINNAYKNACLVVLDPRDMSGCSPTTEDYLPSGCQPAHEKAYIRIPRTVVGSLFERNVKYNAARAIVIEESKLTVRVYVKDVYGIEGRPNERVAAGLYLNFGFDLSLRDITSGDDFDALYAYYVKEEQIPNVNRNEYLRQYKNTMLYWSGEKWMNRPLAANRH